jgi:hypothetical protein
MKMLAFGTNRSRVSTSALSWACRSSISFMGIDRASVRSVSCILPLNSASCHISHPPF